MTKKEVQQRVLQNGKPLDLDKFSWNEKTKTFSSSEDYLVLDFREINNCIIEVGSCCTVDNYIGIGCTISAGHNSVIQTGTACNIKTGSFSNIQVRFGCKVSSGNNCTIHIISDCIVNTKSYCVIRAGYDCTINTSHDCIIRARANCKIKSGSNCVVVRSDIHEVIKPEEDRKIKLNGIVEEGFTYLNEKKEMTVAEISKKLGYDIKIIK